MEAEKTMKTKRPICLALSLAMLLSLLSGCGKKGGNEAPVSTPEPTPRTEYELNSDAAVNKEETVYINVTPDGEVKKVSVTDRLHTDMPQVRIEDKTNLEDIRDVKTFTEPVRDGERLYWDMDSTDLYYSGTSSDLPPMKISVSYTLDGKEIKANFYKCGDELQTPHFLSWNPIQIEQPDFHRPDFFGTLEFE